MGPWPAVAGVWPSWSLWVPSGYAQYLSSIHAPGCLEATLGHAKLDLVPLSRACHLGLTATLPMTV